jgi:PAS domain S-box-containing protein
MNKEFQTRFTVILLGLLTVGVAALGWINFQKEPDFQLPYDGVWWTEHAGHQVAVRVDPAGPGGRYGIKPGDQLVSINKRDVASSADRMRQLFQSGVYLKATYSLVRQGVPLDVELVPVPADRSLNQWQRLIALIYLGIGLYVLLRRWTAPGSLHFYIFCLVSFVLYSFKYTGKFNDFDWVIYWGNVLAGLLQPALFLHFVLTFPENRNVVKKNPWLVPAVYVPGALLLALHVVVLRMVRASEQLRWNVDRMEMLYLATYFVTAAFVLWHSYRRASTPILRQQLKWVTRGTILAITPFTLFYVVPYLLGELPTLSMKISVLSLGLLPLTFGYAIFRYRLMDVDLIFKRGAALYVGGSIGRWRVFRPGGGGGRIGPHAYPEQRPDRIDARRPSLRCCLRSCAEVHPGDYRSVLLPHALRLSPHTGGGSGRELSAETDLDKMLASVVDRLSRTLLVDRMAIFLSTGEDGQNWVLAKSFGLGRTGGLNFSFLNAQRPESEAGHVFFENTHQTLREEPLAREAIGQLDLNYYIPCRARHNTIAYLGLGKTVEGDFLSSEDVELLETLAGYIGIAIQNGRLYASLEQKVAEYERLKDFNENIVESINVGVMAVDLADRVESWNSQMEVMYALPRWQALTRPLSEVFPSAFVEEFYRVRQNPGIHNLYKFRLATPTGETRTVNVAIAPLVTKKFHVIGRLIIMDDITERVDLEAQLSQADKLSSIGLLAAGVAHEVNTPLAVISSYAQMLQKQLQGDAQKSGLMEKITRQTFRASEIVNNLLNFSRTSGTEFTEVSLNKVISDTLALLEHQFRVSKVRVEDELYQDLPTIQGNSGRLQQVFLNLFLNAKDAMPEGGTLRVTTSNGESVSVRVSDTGTGIAQEHIQRIYDPFFTTKTTPQQGQNRGTGLGLSVTYGIIQEHAGKIRVESRPGQGTTFHLDFPFARKTVNV